MEFLFEPKPPNPLAGLMVNDAGDDSPPMPRAATDSAGVFLFPQLLPANYTITVEKTGFQKKVVESVNVQAEQVSSLNVSVAAGIALYEAVRQRRAAEPRGALARHVPHARSKTFEAKRNTPAPVVEPRPRAWRPPPR
mgnify:CR=1 FL=1